MYLEYQFASYIGCEQNLRKVLNSKKNKRQIHDARDSNDFTQLLKKKKRSANVCASIPMPSSRSLNYHIG